MGKGGHSEISDGGRENSSQNYSKTLTWVRPSASVCPQNTPNSVPPVVMSKTGIESPQQRRQWGPKQWQADEDEGRSSKWRFQRKKKVTVAFLKLHLRCAKNIRGNFGIF